MSCLAKPFAMLVVPVVVGLLSSCQQSQTEADQDATNTPDMNTFSEDVAFLKQHTKAMVLGSGSGKIVVVPEYQARIMTSTAGGDRDLSFGWMNYELIEAGIKTREQAKGTLEEHIHVFGGEERFWLGPEGGQFAIFFKPDSAFEFDQWFTPPVIDTEPFDLVSSSNDQATFSKDFELQNFSGTQFKGAISRQIQVLDDAATAAVLGLEALPEDVSGVAYATKNTLTNAGDAAWSRDSGLLSIWMLGMYKPSEKTTVVIPFKSGSEDEFGPKVNDSYFGKVPADKLVVKDDVLFFSGDGTHRSKIGLSPQRAMGVAGSYDAVNQVLTILTYNQQDPSMPYVNSMWEHQEEPFKGDVINSYNDGPPEPGADPLGPFYELESSSPAAELAPGESMTHIQHTLHLQGSEESLSPIAEQVLGASIAEIKSGLD